MQDNFKLHLLISEEDISYEITKIAKKLNEQYATEELVLLMVMKGAFCFVADLIRKIHIKCSVEYIRCISYTGFEQKDLKIQGLDQIDIEGKNVLIVDDIYDSGVTLTKVVEQVTLLKPKNLETLVLLSKQVDRKKGVILPDSSLFDVENTFVVGYGLDYEEHYRGLPGIFSVESVAV